jgi:mannitol/fructose-specific phosphotransferase system IIA component (Ntr-type)
MLSPVRKQVITQQEVCEMDMFSMLKEECIQIGTKSNNKTEILREIAKLAKKSSVLDNISEDFIFNALSERENIASTGFENGLAIPHCHLKEINDFVVGAIVVPEGIDFEALDGEKTDLLFFIIAAENDRDTHIRTLSIISRTLSFKGVKEKLLKMTSPTAFYEEFLRHIPDEIKSKGKFTKCLFNIASQDEEHFQAIVETLSSLSASVSIIEGKDINTYLDKTPLFASLWNTEDKDFHWLATGIINKKLVNELIRSIDSITGGLEENSATTVTIQEVLVSVGSLKA